MAKTELTAERLRELLHYDPTTGMFTWRVSRGTARTGDIAGSTNDGGYIQISVDSVIYKAHRLACLYMTGELPAENIDHRYGNKIDNRWHELRLAKQSQNMQNQRVALSNNKIGLLGVSIHRGRPRATIVVDRKHKHIGYFDTPELAHAAYLEAKTKLHPFQTLTPLADAVEASAKRMLGIA
jgi:hypothetical protein